MKLGAKLSIRVLILLVLFSALACKAFVFRQPDIEATRQAEAGMEAAQNAENGEAEEWAKHTDVEDIPEVELGETISTGDVQIYLPPEIRDDQAPITAVAVTEELPPPPDDSISIGQAYEITSEEELSGPVLISISYDPDELLPDANEENLYIATLVGDEWQAIPDGFVDTENHTVNVSVDHFSFFGVFESVAGAVYDTVESLIGDEITSEYFGDLPQQIRYHFYDLEIPPQNVTAVVHAKLSLTTKAASGAISFGNLVSKTAGLAIGALDEGAKELAKAMGALVFAEVGDHVSDSTAGSFIVACYDSMDLGAEIGSYVVDMKNADPSSAAVKAAAWILGREMEYINENLDPAFKDLWKFNTTSGSRLDVYAVYFDSQPWKEDQGLGASGVKFYYFDEGSGDWVNYYNDVFVWKMTFEADDTQAVSQAEPSETPQPAATTRPSNTPKPSNTPAASPTAKSSATESRPTTGDIFVFPDGSGDYPNLDEAFKAVESGARIILDSGTYYVEEYWGLHSDKSFAIIGIREDLTEVFFTNDNYFSVENNASLTIEDVTFHHDNFSVSVKDGNLFIKDARINAGTNNAIFMQGNSTAIIQGSEFTNIPGAWGGCIELWDDAYIEIENSFLTGCDDGLSLEDNARGIIRGNTIQNSKFVGIRLENNAQATIENNIISDHGYDGINLYNHASATIRSNDCSRNGSDGIYIGDYSSATVEGNTCNNNSSDGIQITGDADVSIFDNECAWNGEFGIDNMGDEVVGLETNDCHDNGNWDIVDHWEQLEP